MVRLPEIEAEKSVSAGASSSVSGAEVENAFGALAAGLDRIGASLEAAEVEDASLRGQDAVYRDGNGAIRFEAKSNFTKSGRAYNRAARTAALAGYSDDAKARMQAFIKEANGDVARFDQLAGAYVNELIGTQDPLMRGPLKTQLNAELALARRGLVETTTRNDLVANEAAIKAHLSNEEAELQALAREGGTATPEYLEKMEKVKSLYAELVGNPGFQTSQREIDARISHLTAANTGEWVIGRVKDTYLAGGIPAAEKFIEEELSNPALPLSAAERKKYQREGRSILNAFKAENRAMLKSLRADAAPLIKGFKDGEAQDPEVVNEMIFQLEGAGDPASALKLRNARELYERTKWFAAATPQERVARLEQMEARATGSDLPIVTATQAGRVSAGSTENVSPQLLTRFRAVQNAFGSSLPIVSGYRDAATNKKAGGAKQSQHLDGNAIDIDVSGLPHAERRRLIEIASANGITGIGVYKNSLHFDIGGRRAWGPDKRAGSVPPWARSAIDRHLTGNARADAQTWPTTFEQLWPRLIQQESGGKQGAVSPKGAIGVAQIMPDTGPVAAKLAGLPWDENRLKTDAAYNEALGKAYLAEQFRVFGDPAKALAAYNAGPTRLQQEIDRHGSNWLAHMPAETRNYVRTILNYGPDDTASIPGEYGEAKKQVVADAKAGWSDIRAGLLRGDSMSAEDAAFLQRQVIAAGDFDLAREMDTFFQSRIADFPEMGLVEQQGTIDAILADGVQADEVEVLQAMRSIHQKTTEQLDSDPLGLVAKIGNYSGGVPPIDMSSSDAFAASLRERQGAVNFVGSFYGKEIGALRPAEVASLAGSLEGRSSQDKAAFLAAMNGALAPETYRATVSQLAKKGGSLLGIAGYLFPKNQEAATAILRGQDALAADPKYAPSRENADAVEIMDEAFPRTAMVPELSRAFADTEDAVRAVYADLSNQVGDKSGQINEARYQRAVDMVTGGLVEWNGRKIIAPQYGMSQADFDKMIGYLTDADIEGARFLSGQPLTMERFVGTAQLTSIGEGRYVVSVPDAASAADPYNDTNRYLVGGDGRKFVLDLRPETRAARSRTSAAGQMLPSERAYDTKARGYLGGTRNPNIERMLGLDGGDKESGGLSLGAPVEDPPRPAMPKYSEQQIQTAKEMFNAETDEQAAEALFSRGVKPE